METTDASIVAATRLPPDLDRKLDTLARETRRTRAGVLRLLVEAADVRELGPVRLKAGSGDASAS